MDSLGPDEIGFYFTLIYYVALKFLTDFLEACPLIVEITPLLPKGSNIKTLLTSPDMTSSSYEMKNTSMFLASGILKPNFEEKIYKEILKLIKEIPWMMHRLDRKIARVKQKMKQSVY